MAKAQNNKAPGAEKPPERYAVTQRRGKAGKQWQVGDILTEAELAENRDLFAGAFEPLREWWGGPLPDPERIDGLLYPRILQRPSDAELCVQSEPRVIRLLREVSRKDALRAIKRCRDREVLSAVEELATTPEARTLATAALAGRYEDTTPVALALGSNSVVIVQANGEERSAIGAYLRDELEPLIAQCEDTRVLRLLCQQDRRITAARIAEIKEKAAERATEAPAPAAANNTTPVRKLLPLIKASSDTAWLTLQLQDRRNGVAEAAEKRLAELAEAQTAGEQNEDEDETGSQGDESQEPVTDEGTGDTGGKE